MFTINIYLRFALIVLMLGGGIALAVAYGIGYSIPFILVGLFLLGGYIFLGTVQSTAQMVQEMNFVEAEKRLNLTWKPEWLYKTNRAFYFIMKGTLAMQRQDHAEAEEWLEKAQKIELPSDNERGMVLLQLANINANRNKWTKAKALFHAAKKLKITQPELKDQMKQMEKAITNRGQMKHMQGMQGRGRKGGFRQKKLR